MKTKCEARPGRAGAYSLIELLTTLAVAGVLLSTSVPAFSGWLLNERRTTVANQLVGTFILARREGATKDRTIVVCGVVDANRNGSIDPNERVCAGTDWSDGWIVAAWSDTNGNGAIEARELRVLNVFDSGARGRITVKANNFLASPPVSPKGTVVMKRMGQHTSNGTLTICDRRGAREARAVILSWTGRARVDSRKADGSPLVCS